MGAFGRNTRRLKAGFATLLLLAFATTFAPRAALAQTITLTATPGDGQVTLSWTLTNVPDAAFDHWAYLQRLQGGSWRGGSRAISGGKSIRTYIVTGLENGTEYDFVVTRYRTSTGDFNPYSNVATATPNPPPGGVTLSPTSLTINEDGSGRYTVKLDTEPSANVTITVDTTGPNASAVTVVGSPLIFTSGNYSTAQTITVRAGIDEDTTDEIVELSHTASSSDTNYGSSLEIDDLRVTVTDTTPTFQLSTDPAAVTEGENISLTVTSDQAQTGNLTVSLTLAARSSSTFTAADIPGALGPRNFTAAFGNSASATGAVTIPTSADSTVEGAEAYRITLNDATGYAIGSDVTADGTLNDGTPPAAPTGLRVTPGNRLVVLSWSDPNNAGITGWQYRQKAGGGAWGAWTDIGSSGATTTSHTVSGLNNGTAYVFQVRARKGNVNGASSGDSSSVTPRRPEPTGNDGDGGDGPEKSVMMTRLSLRVVESVGNATLTVTASPALGESVTFNVTYAGTATGANNPANGDYDNDAVTSITFGPTDTSKNIVIPITDDSVDDDDETIIVRIALAPGNTLPDGFSITRASTTVTITDNDSPSVSVPSTLSVAENAGNAVVRITTTRAFGQPMTFDITYGDGTATGASNPANGDYDNDAVTQVVFNATDTTRDITIPITDDAVAEDDETFTVTIAPGQLSEEYERGNFRTTVTITDDDEPALSIAAPAAVTEGDSGSTDMTFTVSLDAASSRSVTVDYAVAASSTATTNTDFTGGSGTLTFAAGDTSKTITVSVTGDELDEEDETVVIQLSNAGNASIGTATATGTITDDDASPALSIAAPAAVTEGDSGSTDMIFTVSLVAASSRSVTVDYAVAASSTATTNTDFTGGSGTLTFAAGDTSKTITVSVTGDELDEEDETVVIELSNAGNATLGTATATGTITDDDASPELATLAPVTVKLGEAVDLTATATDGDGDTVSYAWTRDASETTPALPGGTGLNQARLTFTPPAIGVYTMTVTAADGNGNTDSGEVTITVGTADTLSLPSTLSVTESATSATIAVTASAALGGSGLTLNVTYNGGNSDTATGANNPANGDYDNDAVTQVVFGASETTKNIVIPITDDDLDEPTETFTVTIAPVSGSLPDGFVLGNATTTVTISDDDESPVLDAIENRTLKLGQTVDMTANATDGDGDPITYQWTRDASETTPALPGGTALNQARLRFEPPAVGVYTMTVTASDGNGNSDTREVTITVVVAAASTVATPSALQVTEGTHRHATVTVTASQAFGTSVTFEVSYQDGTATGASNPTDGDYDNDAVTQVVFGASDTTKNIVIPITDDDLDEPAETFTVTIALADGSTLPAGFVLGNATTTVTISDDDESPGVDATVSAPSALQVTEGTHRHATVTVTASQAFGTSVTFEVSYRDGTATGASNPTDGDYDNDAVTQVVFNASETTKNIAIPITDDDRNESAETFTVTIALADGSTLPDGFVLGNLTTTVTISDDDESPAMNEMPIVDNDDHPGVTLSPTTLEIAEGGSEDYTVVLDTQPSGEVTVTVGGATDEVTVQPASLSFTPTNWSDPQSVTVESAHDDDALPDEAVRLTHRASGGGYNGVTIDPVTVTVVEDDEAAVTLSQTELVIDEGGQGRYTVVLETQPVGGEVTVTPTSAEPMALGVSGALRFGASDWNIAQTVTVTGVRDTDTEDATVRVSHTVSGGDYAGVTAASVTVTVTDQILSGSPERANRINAEVLPQIAAATMSHTLSAVTERMEESASCEARVGSLRLGARPSAPLEDPWGVRSHTEPASPSVSELLDGSSFTLPVGASGTDTASSTLSVWGRGERGSLSGMERAVSWDGELWTAHLGADWCQRSDLVAGAALAYSESDLDAGVGDGAQVAHETKMTSLHPYAVWRLPDGSNLWGSVGYGSGEARISESEDGIHSAALTQDLSQWSVAVGGRRVLLEEESAVGVDRVALKGEGALARLDTAANDGLTSLAVKATRLRLLLEASHERVLANHATLTPSLEAGLRRDGGDLGSGLGLEAGASLLWRAPQTGWTGELRARALVAHERDRDEWGISARLRLDPASDGRGLSLSFGPEYGYTETEMEGLFDYDPVSVATDSAVEEDREGRVQAEMGYGIGISRSGPMALLTPYAGFTLGRSGEETFRVGARYRLGEGLSVGIEGKRQTQAVGESSLMLRAAIRW